MKKNDNETLNREESTFMRLWHNKRTHAAMVLGLWMIFLLFVIIISYVGGAFDNNEANSCQMPSNTITFKDYKEMQSELLKNNFSYVYEINYLDNKIVYKGERLLDKETGYRENSYETIKYYIDESGFYKVVMDELLALDKLFENVNESLIDLESLFEVLNAQSVTSEESEKTRAFTYKYIIDDVNYEVIVHTNIENITEIDINFTDNKYILKYDNINKIEELSFKPNEVN